MSDKSLMTYRELGNALGIGPDAARIRAKRHGLKTKMRKDGVAQVEVPAGYLAAPSRHRRKTAPGEVLQATQAHLADVKDALNRTKAEADKALRRAEQADAERRRAQERADSMADRLTDALTRLASLPRD